MVERFADKKISVLEQICENSFKANNVSDYGINISEKAFIQMFEQFQMFGWLKINHISPLDISGTETEYDGKTLIHYELKNKKGLSDLLLKLKKEYPKREIPHIREKTLELIARDMGEFETGTGLINFLQKCGIEKELIIYPNTKWRMIYDILFYLSYSDRKNDWESLSSIICESIHPLMHNGDWEKSKQLCEKFNQYLIYDRLEINYSTKERKYKISYEPTEEEESEFFEKQMDELDADIEKELKSLQTPENKESIAIIRKSYQVLINIVETFCLNPSKPSFELNDAYLKIKALAMKHVFKLGILRSDGYPNQAIQRFYLPFSNLFSAEAEAKKRGLKKIDWDEIRPEMHETYGQIDTVFREINGSDILSEPDIQKMINDASMLVSETKSKSEEEKKKNKTKELLTTMDDTLIRGFQNMFVPADGAQAVQKAIPIQLVNSQMKIEGLEKGLEAIAKNKNTNDKPKFPHKLPAGTEWKNIIIQFENNENVFIQVKQHKVYASYKEMGFLGRGKNPKPSEAWNFLLVLAKLNGELAVGDKNERDKYKKQKQLLSEQLKLYFSLDSDPFYPYDKNKSYRIKMTLIPPPSDSLDKLEPDTKKDELGLNEYYQEQAKEV